MRGGGSACRRESCDHRGPSHSQATRVLNLISYPRNNILIFHRAVCSNDVCAYNCSGCSNTLQRQNSSHCFRVLYTADVRPVRQVCTRNIYLPCGNNRTPNTEKKNNNNKKKTFAIIFSYLVTCYWCIGVELGIVGIFRRLRLSVTQRGGEAKMSSRKTNPNGLLIRP